MLLLGLNQAHAQFLVTNTDDVVAPGGTALRSNQNSGTDAIHVDDQLLQVMTWDDRDAHEAVFSWAFAGTTGSLRLQPPHGGKDIYDPDVTVSQLGGDVYAALAYIATDHDDAAPRAYLEIFQWDGSSFNHHQGPTALGDLGNSTLPRTHAHPNIDSDDAGGLAVVWQESMTETLTLTFSSSYYGSWSEDVTLRFSDVFMFVGRIDGQANTDCSFEYPGATSRGGYRGSMVRAPPRTDRPSIFEQSSQPDVTIQGEVISVAYMRRSYADNRLFNTDVATDLVAYQVRFASWECNRSPFETIDHYAWPSSVSNPRITGGVRRGENLGPDIEIAAGRYSSGSCPDYRESSRILNFGKSDGAFRPEPTDVTDGVQSVLTSVTPAISYINEDGHYVVTWTGTDYPDVGVKEDVWSRLLLKGERSSSFMRANRGNLKPNEAEGRQRNVSIAGGAKLGDRYSDSGQACFLFFDHEDQTEDYKNLSVFADLGEAGGLRASPARKGKRVPAPAGKRR